MLARQRLLTRFPAKPGGCDFSISGPGDVGHRSGTGRSGGYDDPMTAALAEASGKTPAPPSTPSNKNISLFRISDLWHISAILVPARGALRDRHEMRAGVRLDAAAPARRCGDRDGQPLSHARRGYDTAIVTAAWLIVGGAHIGPRREGLAVRGRRSRVVLTSGCWRQVFAVMWRPDRVRTSTKPQRRRGQQCIAPRGEHEGHR